jgi:hypothetical protein
VWVIVEDLMSRFDLIGSREFSRISFTPPEGYSYLELFVPERRNEILRTLGPNPLLQNVIHTNPNYQMEFQGVLLETETNRFCLGRCLNFDVWGQVTESDRLGALIG